MTLMTLFALAQNHTVEKLVRRVRSSIIIHTNTYFKYTVYQTQIQFSLLGFQIAHPWLSVSTSTGRKSRTPRCRVTIVVGIAQGWMVVSTPLRVGQELTLTLGYRCLIILFIRFFFNFSVLLFTVTEIQLESKIHWVFFINSVLTKAGTCFKYASTFNLQYSLIFKQTQHKNLGL